MYRNILVGIDGSDRSRAALRRALLLAGESGSRVRALAVEEHLPRFAATVGEVDEFLEEKAAYFERLMAEATTLAGEQGVALETEVLPGNAARALVGRAKQLGCNLIVLGHAGHTHGVWGNLLGSTADKVVDHAHCDVLIVR